MNKKKILLIDDDPQFVETVKLRLERNNYEPIVAFDGDEGMEKALKESPDLIILDIGMPKMDGYTFVKKAKTSEIIKDIPIFILTGRSGMKDLFEMEGVSEYIVKPFESDDFLDKISKYLND